VKHAHTLHEHTWRNISKIPIYQSLLQRGSQSGIAKHLSSHFTQASVQQLKKNTHTHTQATHSPFVVTPAAVTVTADERWKRRKEICDNFEVRTAAIAANSRE
jgi:hypothetical protein